MRLPKDLISGNYTKPRIFLCEADKTKIAALETTNTSGSFKFNTYSEISFEVARTYNDILTGEIKINPVYDQIEALRLIYIEGFGYFEIQGPELSSDGIKEFKQVTAYSSEYTLAQKYLENFLINTGETGSVEVTYAENEYGIADPTTMQPVTLYNTKNKELSLLHLVLKKIYGWDIGHVDASLCTLSREFTVDRESVYDFLINEVCQAFNCYIVFDTINNKINVYAEASTQKFMGDGKTREFTISPPFQTLGTVSVGGYKVSVDKYTYLESSGKLTFYEAPGDNEIIEVIDGSLSAWETDVFINFDNLSQEIDVSYESDDIKTVLTVTGADDLDIREVNMGLPYIVDLSYYCTPTWLGRDLYDAYTQYLKDYNTQQKTYEDNAKKINEIDDKIYYQRNKMTSEDIDIVVKQATVTSTTVGIYFTRGGDYPNYYYEEVSLPKDYNAEEIYYLFEGEGLNLTSTDVEDLYNALTFYFLSYFKENKIDMKSLDEIASSFSFIAANFTEMCNTLSNVTTYIKPKDLAKYDFESTQDDKFMFACVNRFLDIMWNQLGSSSLEYYKTTYANNQTVDLEAGHGDETSKEYGHYLATYLLLKSIERALDARNEKISELEAGKKNLQDSNNVISSGLELSTYFKKNYPEQCEQFMIRLSAFLREDEYTDDNFVETGLETLGELYKTKQQLKECGKIELNKLCQPKLKFSMTMANIYALPEFSPIVDQFKLGNVIKVALRPDYIKQSRLLQVNINFDNFADFSCEFGELTNFKTQSDIHADLLSQAISAGKSVASNASYWNKGADQANSIDLRIQQGLLDAATSIKSMDANQGVEIDNYGIHLRKIDQGTQGYDPEQGWITNNKFLYSNDGFKTVKSVFGKYEIGDEEYWGLLAEAVIAGYIEGSDIEGGTIKIGPYPDDSDRYLFTVDNKGNVEMLGGKVRFTEDFDSLADSESRLQEQIDGLQGEIEIINQSKMYRVEIQTTDSQIFNSTDQIATLTAKVYSWDEDKTDEIDVKNFNWIRTSSNPDADIEWNENHKGMKEITITSEDILNNASFSCEVENL